MVNVNLNLPDGLAGLLGASGSIIQRRVLEDVVVEAHRRHLITRAQVAEYLGHDSWHETENLLVERDVALGYGIEDLRHDQKVMDKFLSIQ